MYRLTPEELQAHLEEQTRVHKLADALFNATFDLVEKLNAVKNTADLYDMLHAYYQKAGIIMSEGKVLPSSNVLKMLHGVWQEFETILAPRTFPDEKHRLESQKMTDLVRILTNFSTVLLAARNEPVWEPVEESVFDMLNVVPATEEDMYIAELDIAMAKTHVDILDVLSRCEVGAEEIERVKRHKLALFGDGEMSIRRMQIEKEHWLKFQEQQRVLRKYVKGKPRS